MNRIVAEYLPDGELRIVCLNLDLWIRGFLVGAQRSAGIAKQLSKEAKTALLQSQRNSAGCYSCIKIMCNPAYQRLKAIASPAQEEANAGAYCRDSPEKVI